ncbi:MAG: hypothetical protein J3K34DRAFT_475917 [Monoraphidium minutum]|nr:MAG: hypothetical protein J3K34DRAFT_475917 [Monoraphidium minutum]
MVALSDLQIWAAGGADGGAAAWAALRPGCLTSLRLDRLPSAADLGLSRLQELRGVSLSPDDAAALAGGAPQLRLLAAAPAGDWGGGAPPALPRVTHASFDYGAGSEVAFLPRLLPAVRVLCLEPDDASLGLPRLDGLTNLETLAAGRRLGAHLEPSRLAALAALLRLSALACCLLLCKIGSLEVLPSLETLHVIVRASEGPLDAAAALAAAARLPRLRSLALDAAAGGAEEGAAASSAALRAFARSPGRLARLELFPRLGRTPDVHALAALPCLSRLGVRVDASEQHDLERITLEHDSIGGGLIREPEGVIDLDWVDG